MKKCRTRYLWVLNEANDYSTFDFTWEPPPWESEQIHIWPSQHQMHGGTMLLPKAENAVENFNHNVIPRAEIAPKLVIQHLSGQERSGNISTVEILPDSGNISTRYIADYMSTMRRALKKVDWEYCWVTSDLCKYDNFDFTWHPATWQEDYLHVFASNGQKFGDTFFVNVKDFLACTENLEILEYYPRLNFVEDIRVPRPLEQVITYTDDSLVDAVWKHKFTTPVELFTKSHSVINLSDIPTISLWQERLKTVVPLSAGAETCLIPKEVKNHLETQIYDYPWIEKQHKNLLKSQPCDVIFISNGEPMAELNWLKLLAVCPQAKRSDGVTGRELAYKTAAKLSDTDWFYAVFAKTEVLGDFKFDFQPDRLQQPKHYIFHSRNPLNGLEYGAMNINLYNKQLVLDTDPGLDFTLSQLHDVIPLCISVSRFNTDPWITWRSAFREVLKLKQEVDAGAGPEIQHRLETWCTVANGENAEYCLQGANDALEYYAHVQGCADSLQNSFDWAWLEEFYFNKYKRKLWLEVE